MNWKGFGRKTSWLNQKYYSGFCPGGQRKMKTPVRKANVTD
jgi:hypothetical protein